VRLLPGRLAAWPPGCLAGLQEKRQFARLACHALEVNAAAAAAAAEPSSPFPSANGLSRFGKYFRSRLWHRLATNNEAIDGVKPAAAASCSSIG